MSESVVGIVYVGKKPFSVDNVAGSGKFWEGNGCVREVTVAQAKTLLNYPDQWALADESEQAIVDKKEALTVIDGDGDSLEISPESLNKPVEKMNKPQLVALAKSLGKELGMNVSRKEMIGLVEDWMDEEKQRRVE